MFRMLTSPAQRVPFGQVLPVPPGAELARVTGSFSESGEPIDPNLVRLVERVRDGDVQAFEDIVHRYWNGTFTFARYLSQDSDLADDVTQESFAKLWERRAELRPTGSVRSLLLRTVRNLVIDEHRKKKVREIWARERQRDQSRPATPLQEAETNDLLDQVDRAIMALSPRRRDAFILFHMQGLSYREAAEIMSVRPQTIANYVHAAIEELRVSLAKVWPLLSEAQPARVGEQIERHE